MRKFNYKILRYVDEPNGVNQTCEVDVPSTTDLGPCRAFRAHMLHFQPARHRRLRRAQHGVQVLIYTVVFLVAFGTIGWHRMA